jgi:RNA polymerase sigma-70 factor (ECF subfamily)
VSAGTTHITLLERLSSGDDRAAWREFCDRYGALIRGFALRAGSTEADADDVLQDVLIALVKAMPEFRYDPTKGRFRGYLKTIVLRALSKRRRQNQAAGLLQPSGDLDEADVAALEAPMDPPWEAEWRQYHLRMAMTAAEAEFSAQDRAAFQHYAVDGRSAQETAALLGLSVDQVYQAKSRILRRLGELIAAQVEAEG